MNNKVSSSHGDQESTAASNTDSSLVNDIQFTLLFHLPKGGKRKKCDKPKEQNLWVADVIQPSSSIYTCLTVSFIVTRDET